MIDLNLKYSPKQKQFFFPKVPKRIRLMPKGRRTGFTYGASNHIVDENLEEEHRVLWVDTVHGNIDRYVERYFMPKLKLLPRSWYNWNKLGKELRICDTLVDFRSRDKPENIEGFGYDRIYINEAGIVLKGERGRYIYENAILPMTADYGDKCIQFIGGTPKGIADKSGQLHKYYELCEKAKTEEDYLLVHMATHENPFLPRSGVANVKRDLPPGPARDQEYYGKFVQGTGNIIKKDWLPIGDRITGDKVRFWDTAIKDGERNDFYAGALCCYDKTHLQVQNVVRFKELWMKAKEILIATIISDGQTITQWFEDSPAFGTAIEDLRADPRMHGYSIKQKAPKGEKFVRAMPWVARASCGRVSLLAGAWNQVFINECVQFTNDDSHAHDDQIDAVSGAWDVMGETTFRVR